MFDILFDLAEIDALHISIVYVPFGACTEGVSQVFAFISSLPMGVYTRACLSIKKSSAAM